MINKKDNFITKPFLMSKIEALVLTLGLGYFTYAHSDMFWFVVFVVFCFLRVMTRFEKLHKSVNDLENEVKFLKLFCDNLPTVNRD